MRCEVAGVRGGIAFRSEDAEMREVSLPPLWQTLPDAALLALLAAPACKNHSHVPSRPLTRSLTPRLA